MKDAELKHLSHTLRMEDKQCKFSVLVASGHRIKEWLK